MSFKWIPDEFGVKVAYFYSSSNGILNLPATQSLKNMLLPLFCFSSVF